MKIEECRKGMEVVFSNKSYTTWFGRKAVVIGVNHQSYSAVIKYLDNNELSKHGIENLTLVKHKSIIEVLNKK